MPVRTEALRSVVELACLAPSIHNTQPWTWRVRRGLLELHADHSRRLSAADPTGRSLVISCGAALHHAQVAARALGWRAEVDRLPEGPTAALLATLRLRRSTPSLTATVGPALPRGAPHRPAPLHLVAGAGRPPRAGWRRWQGRRAATPSSCATSRPASPSSC